MQSRRYVAKYGAIRFLSCPGQAETVSKFPAISGAEWKMPSPTPPKSAKVKLRSALQGASRRMATNSVEQAAILRDARKSALLRMRSKLFHMLMGGLRFRWRPSLGIIADGMTEIDGYKWGRL